MNILQSGRERRNSSVFASKGSIAQTTRSIVGPSIASARTKKPRSLNDRACSSPIKRNGLRTGLQLNPRFNGCSAGIASSVDENVLTVLEWTPPREYDSQPGRD